VGYAEPPGWLLADAGLEILPGDVRPRQGRAWLAGWGGIRVVIRQQAASGPDVRAEDVTWLHAFLTRLAGLGFPSPRPVPCFAGRSWTMAEGALWEVVSFLPGWVAGWAAKPAMEEIGALLARYHDTVRQIEVTGQRPTALPLAEVPAVLRSSRLEAVHLDPDVAAIIRREAERLARDLDETGHLAPERVVIHGDFTNHNVIAAGTPPRATGVIDFAGAHVERPLADIGYGLWRSGRPRQEADSLDLARIARFVRGYAMVLPVSADQARRIPVYIRGRGLQMIAKRVRAGRAEAGMLAEVRWLSVHGAALGDALAAATS
jgi:Ser/Thr protein kinase RdoA (MazF antagonist)